MLEQLLENLIISAMRPFDTLVMGIEYKGQTVVYLERCPYDNYIMVHTSPLEKAIIRGIIGESDRIPEFLGNPDISLVYYTFTN